MLERQRSFGGLHKGAHWIVAHRDNVNLDAQSGGQFRCYCGQGLARLQPPCAFHMKGQVAVTQLKPVFAAQLSQRAHEGPGFPHPAPASVGVVETGQRIGQRIQVGADRQTEMFKVIAGVDDNLKRLSG